MKTLMTVMRRLQYMLKMLQAVVCISVVKIIMYMVVLMFFGPNRAWQ